MTHNPILNTTWEDLPSSNYSRLQENSLTHQNITYVDFYLHKPSVAAVFTASYLLIFLVCMVGNGVVCFIVLRSKNMRTVTNLFILNLAISDLLVGIFCMPTTLVDNIITGQNEQRATRVLQDRFSLTHSPTLMFQKIFIQRVYRFIVYSLCKATKGSSLCEHFSPDKQQIWVRKGDSSLLFDSTTITLLYHKKEKRPAAISEDGLQVKLALQLAGVGGDTLPVRLTESSSTLSQRELLWHTKSTLGGEQLWAKRNEASQGGRANAGDLFKSLMQSIIYFAQF